jgi:thioredoxin-like negative regulator of GroEL
VTLADPALSRQAGRFVWLELNFDDSDNKDFLLRHQVTYTPSLYVIEPRSGRVAASHFGGVSLSQLTDFLDRGARGVAGGVVSPADSALARGDGLLGRGQLAEAAADYRAALAAGGPGWAHRETAVAQLVWTLMSEHQDEASAEVAVAEAPKMARRAAFARVVLAGLLGANGTDSADWAAAARARLVPLAGEAVELKQISRNDRFQLYQEMMIAAGLAGDKATVTRRGERWLGEIDRTAPKNEDERTALDVARVDAVSILGTPERAIPGLQASEKAMPSNYDACLRLAQVQNLARRYDDAIASCDRGLARVDGPIGTTWLLETKAEALMGKGDNAQACQVLEDARGSANAIVTESSRNNNLRRISRMLAEAQK